MEGSCVRSPRRSEGPALNVNSVKELPLVPAQLCISSNRHTHRKFVIAM